MPQTLEEALSDLKLSMDSFRGGGTASQTKFAADAQVLSALAAAYAVAEATKSAHGAAEDAQKWSARASVFLGIATLVLALVGGVQVWATLTS